MFLNGCFKWSCLFDVMKMDDDEDENDGLEVCVCVGDIDLDKKGDAFGAVDC